MALLEAENFLLPGAGLQKRFLAKNEAMFNKATAHAIWLRSKGAGRFTFTDGARGAKRHDGNGRISE